MSLISINLDWPIRIGIYQVMYRKAFPLEELDHIILELLAEQNDEISFQYMGSLLGFAINKDILYDKAEEELFQFFLSSLTRYHLITVENEVVKTTSNGKIARNESIKYLFYQGNISLHELHLLHEVEGLKQIFPFHQFGLNPSLSNEKEIDPFKFEQEKMLESFLLQKALTNFKCSDEQLQWVDNLARFISSSVKLNLSLYELDGQYEIKTSLQDIPSGLLDDIIRLPGNTKVYRGWLLKLQYELYRKDALVLEASQLREFIPCISWSRILNDVRVTWNKELFCLLADKRVSNTAIWDHVVTNCPTEILVDYLHEYTQHLNWEKLTRKLSKEYILSKINNHPWDLQVVSEVVSQEELHQILLQLQSPDLPNWEELTIKVSPSFLSKHFERFPFDLYTIVQLDEVHAGELIIAYPDRRWDYIFIVTNYSLQFLAKHITLLAPFIPTSSLVRRMLRSKGDFETVINHDGLRNFLLSKKDQIDLKIGVQHQGTLDKDMLNFLDEFGLLFWGNGCIPGIAANEGITWTTPIFEAYYKQIADYRGFEQVSNTVDNIATILQYESFPWNYRIISGRKNLNWTIDIIRQIQDKLELSILLNSIPISIIVNEIEFFIDWADRLDIRQKLVACIYATFTFSDVMSTREVLHSQQISVDWHRMLIPLDSIACGKLMETYSRENQTLPSNEAYRLQLSQKSTLSFILDFPSYKWNWKYVTTKRISTDSFQQSDFLKKYATWLYWPHILENIITEEYITEGNNLAILSAYISKAEDNIKKVTWTAITKKIRPTRLVNLIRSLGATVYYNWDWDYISALPNIPVEHTFLTTWEKRINWKLLSGNQTLQKFFQFSKEVYSSNVEWLAHCREYLLGYQDRWDFRALSKINNLVKDRNIVDEFKDKWDWTCITKESTLLLFYDKEKQISVLDGRKLNQFHSYVDWDALSERYDLVFPLRLVKDYIRKGWNFSKLSLHPRFEFDKSFLVANHNRDWSYKSLSRKENLRIDKELILELHDKDWDWEYFSSASWLDNDLVIQLSDKPWGLHNLLFNKNIIFDLNILQIFVEKEFKQWELVLQQSSFHISPEVIKLLTSKGLLQDSHWCILSGHAQLDFKQHPLLLELYREYWHWDELIRKEKFDVNNIELLRKFKLYIDWEQVINTGQFIPEIDICKEFYMYLDWAKLSELIPTDVAYLRLFKNVIHWGRISSREEWPFTIPLIEEFSNYWDYYHLMNNINLPLCVREYIEDKIAILPELQLYLKLKGNDNNWAGYIYHFTHITNALDIIQSRKIWSRNKAGGFSDAAGSVVARREDAHNYARFYFRPQTPTQFYNENLGKDSSKHIGKAARLGYPKCPIPVFFKFNLQEVILKQKEKCYISNGNMQTNWAIYNPIAMMLNTFNFNDVYSTFNNTSDGNWKTYINYSQQEFLVKDFLDFKDINDYEILVANGADKDQLTQVFNYDNQLKQRIKIDYGTVFHGENKKVNYIYKENLLELSTDYFGNNEFNGKLIVECAEPNSYDFIDGNVINATASKVEGYPRLTLKISHDQPFRVKFYDNLKDRHWIIYENRGNPDYQWAENKENIRNRFIDKLISHCPMLKPIYDQKVRHYVLKNHTACVLKVFDKYFNTVDLPIDADLFRLFLALHDIGKPAAVLQGYKGNQYFHTKQIIRQIWPLLSYPEKDMQILLALAEGDYVGDYFQGKIQYTETINHLTLLAHNCGLEFHSFLMLYLIYYQCDIAAYTADDGGIPFLEKLFSYHNDIKVFNTRIGFLTMSESYQHKLEELTKLLTT